MKRLLSLGKSSIYFIFVIIGGLFLLIELMTALVMLIIKPDSTFLVAPLILPAAAGLTTVMVSTKQAYSLFQLAIKMGATRKSTLSGLLLLIFGESFAAILTAWLLAHLDMAITYRVWGTYIPGLHISGTSLIIPFWGMAAIAVGVPMLGMILTAALHKFGAKALWIVWALYMVLCLAPGAVGGALVKIPRDVLYLLPFVVLGIFLWAISYLRKASIK
ncbi:MAG: hypothetical protein AB7D36_06465 [Oscillospiraceae bacterium]